MVPQVGFVPQRQGRCVPATGPLCGTGTPPTEGLPCRSKEDFCYHPRRTHTDSGRWAQELVG